MPDWKRNQPDTYALFPTFRRMMDWMPAPEKEETIRTSLELDECFKVIAPQPRVGIPSIRSVGLQGTAL